MRAALVVLVLTACNSSSPAPQTRPPVLSERPSPDAVAIETSPARIDGPLADMSTQLGGMRLGMSVAEFFAQCREGGGEAQRVAEIDLACSTVPIPLRSGSHPTVDFPGIIAATFCGTDATACELMYMVLGGEEHRNAQVEALATMLATKYGPPSDVSGYTKTDVMNQCVRERSVHFKQSWIFGPRQSPPHPVAWARLVFDCDLRDRARTNTLTLFYSDEAGIRRRMDAHTQEKQNY